MHEMSLAEGILQICEDAAAREGCRRVTEIRLEIGALAGVEVESLSFCLDVVLQGSIAEGARVELERLPGLGHCLGGGETVPVATLYDACPRCGSYQVQATGGTDMRVKGLLVESLSESRPCVQLCGCGQGETRIEGDHEHDHEHSHPHAHEHALGPGHDAGSVHSDAHEHNHGHGHSHTHDHGHTGHDHAHDDLHPAGTRHDHSHGEAEIHGPAASHEHGHSQAPVRDRVGADLHFG